MVKIADVAKHAGVSMSTVSYVLSGKRSISESTQLRVQDSIRKLGYTPHAGARALASNRTNVLALVVPLRQGDFVPVIMMIATAVVTTARKYGYDVLLLTQDEGAAAIDRAAQSALVDGFIVMDIQLHDVRLPALRRNQRPAVLIGVPEDPDGLTCVDFDFAAAGRLCAEHLAELGHRVIALVGPAPAVYERETGFAARVAYGFTDAAQRSGVRASVHACEADVEAGRAMAARLVDELPGLTAVVIHNEAVVEPIVAEFERLGRRVPEDISIVAVRPDDSVAGSSTKPLTSVPLPAEQLGVLATELLMDKLAKRVVPDITLLPPRVGDPVSSLPAPAGARRR